jgi:hypothetical protein
VGFKGKRTGVFSGVKARIQELVEPFPIDA